MPDRIVVAVEDLGFAALCRENGYGIEIQPFLEAGMVPTIQRVLGDLHPRSLHGPFGDLCAGSYDPLIREVTRDRFDLACRFARVLESPDIILHHGYVPGTSPPQNWLPRCVTFWHDFLADKEQSLRFHVENMLEWNAVLLADVIDEIDDPRVDVCLDIGHCHCNSRKTPVQWIEGLGTRIGWVHMHNNNGAADEHLALDQGTIPIEEVCHALVEHAPKAVWCLEAFDEGLAASIDFLKANEFS